MSRPGIARIYAALSPDEATALASAAQAGDISINEHVRRCVRDAAARAGVDLPPCTYARRHMSWAPAPELRADIPEEWAQPLRDLAAAAGLTLARWSIRACGLAPSKQRQPMTRARARKNARLRARRAQEKAARLAAAKVPRARQAGACPMCGAAHVALRRVMDEAVARCAAGHDWWVAA